mgnify:CR=1 FL=1
MPAAGFWTNADSLYTLRRDVKNRAEAMNTVLDWPDRVLVISQGDDATRWYYYKYELTAKVVNGYGGTWWGNDDYSSRWDSDFMNLVESLNWTLYDFEAVCTADSLTAYMEEKQIDYLLIDRADDYLEREFSSRFEGGLKAKYARNPPIGLNGPQQAYRLYPGGCGRKRGGTMKDKRPTKRFARPRPVRAARCAPSSC